MTKFDRIIFSIILGALCPVSLMLGFKWFSYTLFQGNGETLAMIIGFLLGAAMDLLLLKVWLEQTFTMTTQLQIMIYLFFAIGIFFLFVAAPILNLITGALAGYYWGRRLLVENALPDRVNRIEGRVALFSMFILVITNLFSVYILLNSALTAIWIENLLQMTTRLTNEALLGIFAALGVICLVLQWLLVKLSLRGAMSLPMPVNEPKVPMI